MADFRGSGTQADPYTYLVGTALEFYISAMNRGARDTFYVKTGSYINLQDDDPNEGGAIDDAYFDWVDSGYGLSVSNWSLVGTFTAGGASCGIIFFAEPAWQDQIYFIPVIPSSGPTLHVKFTVSNGGGWVGGKPFVKVNGAWREAKKVYVKVNGAWKESK